VVPASDQPLSMEQQPGQARRPVVANVVHEVVRCKWSLQILGRIRSGIRRPGAIRRSCPGLSTKVLNERLSKLVRLGVLERRAFAQVPLRVEYYLTAFGRRFTRILDAIDRLQAEVDRAELPGLTIGDARRRM